MLDAIAGARGNALCVSSDSAGAPATRDASDGLGAVVRAHIRRALGDALGAPADHRAAAEAARAEALQLDGRRRDLAWQRDRAASAPERARLDGALRGAALRGQEARVEAQLHEAAAACEGRGLEAAALHRLREALALAHGERAQAEETKLERALREAVDSAPELTPAPEPAPKPAPEAEPEPEIALPGESLVLFGLSHRVELRSPAPTDVDPPPPSRPRVEGPPDLPFMVRDLVDHVTALEAHPAVIAAALLDPERELPAHPSDVSVVALLAQGPHARPRTTIRLDVCWLDADGAPLQPLSPALDTGRGRAAIAEATQRARAYAELTLAERRLARGRRLVEERPLACAAWRLSERPSTLAAARLGGGDGHVLWETASAPRVEPVVAEWLGGSIVQICGLEPPYARIVRSSRSLPRRDVDPAFAALASVRWYTVATAGGAPPGLSLLESTAPFACYGCAVAVDLCPDAPDLLASCPHCRLALTRLGGGHEDCLPYEPVRCPRCRARFEACAGHLLAVCPRCEVVVQPEEAPR